jgi:hypothetical protein
MPAGSSCGEEGWKTGQRVDRRGCCGQRRRQDARSADLIDRVDTVAAAAFGDKERVVEDRLAAEVVVFAGFVCRPISHPG